MLSSDLKRSTEPHRVQYKSEEKGFSLKIREFKGYTIKEGMTESRRKASERQKGNVSFPMERRMLEAADDSPAVEYVYLICYPPTAKGV